MKAWPIKELTQDLFSVISKFIHIAPKDLLVLRWATNHLGSRGLRSNA